MPQSSSPSAPTTSSSSPDKDRTHRPTPAGPRRRADTKSEVRPPPRLQSLDSASRNVSANAGPSTTSISVNRSQSATSESSQRKEMMAPSSRTKSSSKDALSPPSRSHSYTSAGLTDSPLTGSPASDVGRYGTTKSTLSPGPSPTISSPLSAASLGRNASARLGPTSQRSYESFSDFRGNQVQRRTTAPDSQAPVTSHSHIQPGSSLSTSESFRAQASSSRAAGQASVSVSRKSSVGTGTGSDREGGGHLDLKRLLSKPALPNHSGSSIISLPSDSEPSTSPSPSRRLMTAQAQAQDILRQRAISSSRPLRERPSARSMSALAESTSRPGVRDPAPRQSLTPSTREQEREKEAAVTSKPRAVLRRKNSARSGTSTPLATSTKLTLTNSSSSNETSRGSASRQPIRSSDTARPAATSSSSCRRVGSVTADPISVRGGLRDSAPPPGLTPAGAVAHAYKQQEERREKLAEMSGWNDTIRSLHSQRSQSSLSSLSFANMMTVNEDDAAAPDPIEKEETNGPYYTVFGSSADRSAFADTKLEDWQMNFDTYRGPQSNAPAVPPKPGSGHGSTSSSGVKGLTRKMSGRLKKVTGGGRVCRDESPQRAAKEGKDASDSLASEKRWLPYDGRNQPSQERVGVTLDIGRVEIQVKEKTSPTSSSLQSDRIDSSRRVHKSSKSKDKDREDESSAGGKIWKLMKRISTGGLRDKYHSTNRDASPPPVPALPKDLPTRLTLDIQQPPSDELVGESGILLSRFMQSRSSMSGVRPSTAPSVKTARADTDPRSRPSTGTKADPRPSTTTRSSSPVSSDMASTKFFQKSHSNRSSTTSYGEELPPLPLSNAMHGVPVSQHIISPSELYRLDDDDDASHPSTPISITSRRKPARSRSVPDDPSFLTSPVEAPRPSLPFPPRRPPQSNGSKSSYSPPSPTIPAFNTTGAVNNFPGDDPPSLSLSMTEFGVSDSPRSAPPRPRKSSRRLTDASDVSPTSSSSPGTATPRTPILPSLKIDVFSRTRRSISTSSRSHPRDLTVPVTPVPLPLSPSAGPKAPLTFRDMESPRAALSEKEKAAKWDDLLERSARAGGTLHLGETGLMSDNLRFSLVSEG